MNYSSEELNQIFQTLPEELKHVIVSVDTAKIVNDTGKKYGLHIDQIGEVATQTGLVLLGVTHPTEFVSNLTRALGIERVVASQIASDINDKIFLKVRELLRGATEIIKTKEEPVEENGPRPLRDALIKAIENPEGVAKKPEPPKTEIPLVEIKKPYEPAKPKIGKDTPVVAPIPQTATTSATEEAKTPQAASILEQKLSGPVSITKEEKKVDPYREQI